MNKSFDTYWNATHPNIIIFTHIYKFLRTSLTITEFGMITSNVAKLKLFTNMDYGIIDILNTNYRNLNFKRYFYIRKQT